MVNNHCKLNQSLTIQTFIFKIFLKENTQLCKPAETHMKVIQMSSYIKFEGQHIPAHPHPKPCCLTFDRRRSIKTDRQKEKLFLVFFSSNITQRRTSNLGFIVSLYYLVFPLQLWSSSSGQKAVFFRDIQLCFRHSCSSATIIIAKHVQKQQPVLNTVAVY